ncbi:SRPBCC family protein [Nocardia sp. CA-290969]|uniref:SRPBCC family protein n=1 Tax=Nocardia sp. CA-290969 TaxID=3239986 RepID=UPI003D8CAE59
MNSTDADHPTISLDQFIAAPPAKVWRALTDPELHGKWWAPGDIAATVGHRFHLEMPGWGSIPCEVVEVDPERRFVYTFNENWTLAWQLTPQDNGTLLHLDHSGFDLAEHKSRDAYGRMGPGWRDKVLPGLARLAEGLPD